MLLGVSVVTIRRMIRRGRLEAERVHRPQGSAYLVTLPVDGTGDGSSTEQPAQNVSRANGTATELMAVWSETFLGPIMGRMAEQETTIRDQAETIGGLRAELAAACSKSPLVASTGPEIARMAQESSDTRSWRDMRWLWTVIGAVLAIVVVVGLLVLPR